MRCLVLLLLCVSHWTAATHPVNCDGCAAGSSGECQNPENNVCFAHEADGECAAGTSECEGGNDDDEESEDKNMDYLIAHPDELCDEFGIAPKPYWLLFLKMFLTQAILGLVFSAKPKSKNWWKEHPTRLQVYIIAYQVLTGIMSFFAAIASFHSPSSTIWENYERVAYLLAQSAGTATCMQLGSIRWCGSEADGEVENKEQSLLEKTRTNVSEMLGGEDPNETKGSHLGRLQKWFGAEQAWVGGNNNLYGKPACVMALFLVVPLLTHAIPMLFVYPWLTAILWLFLEASSKVDQWVRHHEKASKGELVHQALLLLLLTAVFTYVATTCVGYGILFYHVSNRDRLLAQNRTLLSTHDYLEVIATENDSRETHHYVRCLSRKVAVYWTTAADALAMV
jgi:hypothetical protein